ncbi:MAG: glycoside hydrolase family 57 protein [Thiohalophilus sp.]|uniref:glycoside hydrolase family 57 protein n=1 Tax=Thiohalophilus sp. TaxID=3028392 RepID=UPI0028701F1E|nr:glycoside hydrolase family 57 protein [Thiohalophilus sp.]MDR9435918.1 glycoside hydrolase family 57 protein [Thiohalophilus sp.]
MSAKPLNVVLYWHMHQPEYRDRRSGDYHLPWTYLHAIKDYVDMAAHLEANPAARAVVNFTPTLLEQIDDYARQIQAFFLQGTEIHDPLLDALARPVMPGEPRQRLALIKQCLRANETRLIQRYPNYQRLAEFASWLDEHPDAIIYLHDRFLTDLLTWFHLAWLGETVRRENPQIQALIDKGINFNQHDRHALLRLIGELCDNVIGRYRALAEQGRIELSVTPYAHPIMPLLLDIHSAREAMPETSLPVADHYPGGEERVVWHIEKGLEVFEQHFGFRPAGCWPSEGSISEATIRLLSEHGFTWLASGDTVLRNSLNANHTDSPCLHTGYRYADTTARCFFRDDGLSDLIGFDYATWHADDAVANLLHHLENIAEACREQANPVVSIILDGENAWEFYPENGYYFLEALYAGLADHPDLNLTTYSTYLAEQPEPVTLDRVVAGSWVYGTFSTWIGDPGKNRAWELLVEAKRACDQQLASREFSAEQRDVILTQLAICEGSDWFWWFGDYNPAESVRDFDQLYRQQLSNLYMQLGLEPPDVLAEPISHGGGQPSAGGTMRRGQDAD